MPHATEEVRVLRDVAATEAGPSLGANGGDSAEVEIRRLPPVEPAAKHAATTNGPDSAAVAEKPAVRQPSAVSAERAVAVKSSAVQAADPNPLRIVVPEPQTAALQTSPPPAAQAVQPHVDAAETDPSLSAAKSEKPVPPLSGHFVVEPAMRPLGRAWEEPASLLAQLQELSRDEATQVWATAASNAIRRLGPAISVGAADTAIIMENLDRLVRETPSLVPKINDAALAQSLSCTSAALQRRITVWKQIGQMGGMAAADAPAPAVDPGTLKRCLTAVDQLTADSSEGHAWRKYLLIESLHEWAARRRNEERLPRDLAQQVLKRFNQMSVTSHQRQFLTSGPLAALQREMVRSTAEAVPSNRLLQHLENYERSGLPSDGRLLAEDCQFLAVGSGAGQRELGQRVETYYRNANLRFSVTADFLNRFVPKREPEFADVKDTIQNVPVRGQSLMASEVSVRMIPNPHHVYLALEVRGEVAAQTRSDAGQAVFYSDSESSYVARKPLELTLRGINMWPTEVSVDNNSQLKGVSTGLDGVPLLNRVARDIARSEHDKRLPAADAEVRQKIADQARARVDQETTQQIAAAAKLLRDEVLGPMDSLLLDPTMVAAETTEKRFSMRVRLAGPDQLGGHTPRPQAPSDSLASVQIHESMINNVLERLELDGQTFDLKGLGQRLAERLHRYQPKPVDPDQEDVKITFAGKDALRVRCNEGRVEIRLAIARLSKGPRKWKDFQVAAVYRPIVQGRSVDLTREGVVQLIGARMNVGSQIALRGVFSRVFSQKEPIHATPAKFVKNPKFNGLAVTQLVIDDGWVGVAIGPQQTTTAQAGNTLR